MLELTVYLNKKDNIFKILFSIQILLLIGRGNTVASFFLRCVWAKPIIAMLKSPYVILISSAEI